MKKLLFLAILLPSISFGAIDSLIGKSVERDRITANKNFNDLDRRVNNSVAKSSTETVHGIKYFPSTPWIPKVMAKVTFSGGTPSLAYSVGVTSVTDNGAGNTRINFSTQFSNSSYFVLATSQDDTSDASCSYDEATDNVAGVDVVCRVGLTATATDVNFFVVVFGVVP